MQKRKLATTFQVRALYERLAGKKLADCDRVANDLVATGYKVERAWAEALAKFKLPNTLPDTNVQ